MPTRDEVPISEADEFLERLDEDVAAAMYRRISIDVDRFERTLRTAGRSWARSQPPADLEELRETASWVVDQSALRSRLLGTIAAVSGAASVPAETVARSLSTLRLAQRLLIVYGLDPHSDRGRTAMWRVLAAALETGLPSHGPVRMKATELLREDRSLSATLTRALLRRAARTAVPRVLRLIPGASVPVHGSESVRRTREAGERMIEVLDRLAAPAPTASAVDALEVEGH